MPVRVAASISSTSMWRPSAIATQWLADAAGLGRRLPLAVGADAVERAGDDPRGGGLADAADAGQKERVRDPAGAQRVGQRPDQRRLADQLGQALRPVGPGEHPIGLGAPTARIERGWWLVGRRCRASDLAPATGPEWDGGKGAGTATRPELVTAASFRT